MVIDHVFFGGVLYFQRDPYIDTSYHIFRHTMYMQRNLEKNMDPETGYGPLMVSQMGFPPEDATV